MKTELIELYNKLFENNILVENYSVSELEEFCKLLSLITNIQCFSKNGITENWYYIYLSAINSLSE